jgi:hypothetical protein
LSSDEASDEGSDSDFEMGSVHKADCQSPGAAKHLCSTDDKSSSSDDPSDDAEDSDDDDTSVVSDDLPTAEECHIQPVAEKPKVSSSIHSNKVKIESSVRLALGAKKAPLLAFFKQCSTEEYNANLQREQETMQGDLEHARASTKPRSS